MGHGLFTWVWVKQPLHSSISAYEMQHSSSIATATRKKICLCSKKVKGHPSIIVWMNMVDLVSLMLQSKIQPQSFLGSRKEDF